MAIDCPRGVDKLLLVGLEDLGEFDRLAVFGRATSRGCGWRLGWLIGHLVLLGSCHNGEVRLLEAKRPPRRGEWKDRGHGEEGVEHEESRRVMAYCKLSGHVHQPHRQGWPLGRVCLVLLHVGKALMQAGLKRETPGL